MELLQASDGSNGGLRRDSKFDFGPSGEADAVAAAEGKIGDPVTIEQIDAEVVSKLAESMACPIV